MPLLSGSFDLGETNRDARRVFGAWQSESVVWLLPMVKRLVRWRDQRIRQLALPSESFDRIDIVHVTEEGMIYSPVRQDLPTEVDGLLDAWLNVLAAGGCDFVVPPESLTVPIPAFDDAGNWVGSRQYTFKIGPGSYLPVISVDPESRTVAMQWPPNGSPAPVSPDAESAKLYLSKRIQSDPPVVITTQGDKTPQALLRWPSPLTSMMPLFRARIYLTGPMC
jgi:hypothetical protein